jgi:hypothetical protein
VTESLLPSGSASVKVTESLTALGRALVMVTESHVRSAQLGVWLSHSELAAASTGWAVRCRASTVVLRRRSPKAELASPPVLPERARVTEQLASR